MFAAVSNCFEMPYMTTMTPLDNANRFFSGIQKHYH